MTEAEVYTLYRGVYLPSSLHPPECLKYCEEFAFRKDDILIVTYPKSGTTWMQEIVPLIVSGGDPASVETLPTWERVPWLEVQKPSAVFHFKWPSPRMFATHFQYNMMPPSFFEVKPKMATFLEKPGLQSEFLHKFLDGRVVYGCWFDHVKGWLNAEDKKHIVYISYEEMIMDLKASVSRIAQFLEKPLDAEVMEKIAERCLFKNMKKNKMSNFSTVPPKFFDQTKSAFLRKGIAGDWKNQLTAGEAERFDGVYRDRMKDVKYKFVWD